MTTKLHNPSLVHTETGVTSSIATLLLIIFSQDIVHLATVLVIFEHNLQAYKLSTYLYTRITSACILYTLHVTPVGTFMWRYIMEIHVLGLELDHIRIGMEMDHNRMK